MNNLNKNASLLKYKVRNSKLCFFSAQINKSVGKVTGENERLLQTVYFNYK